MMISSAAARYLLRHCLRRQVHQSKKQSSTRCLSSSSSTRNAADATPSFVFPFRSTSLGLEPSFVRSHLPSISQLPEIKALLANLDHDGDDNQNSTSATSTTRTSAAADNEDSLQRARDIFSQLQLGGSEHKAVLALLAECQQRNGHTEAALQSLLKLQDFCDNARSEVDVLLAQSKIHWMTGNFAGANEICSKLVEQDGDVFQESLPLHYIAAVNGTALCRALMTDYTLDDAFTIREPAQRTVNLLELYQEQSFPSPLLLQLVAASQLNLGVAQVIYASILEKENDLDDIRMDASLRAWKTGLTSLKKCRRDQDSSKTISQSPAFLEARLHLCMAWALLHKLSSSSPTMNQDEDLSLASEIANKALKVFDGEQCHTKEDIGWTLSLVATCYHKAGQAVTAEGLLQSSLSSFPSSSPSFTPQHRIMKMDVLQRFADLCSDWDRREGDAKQYEDQVSQVEETLPPGWQGKSAIHSALWFWTPTTLY